MSTKAERAEYIRKRSEEMARSGDHLSYSSIEHKLRMEGYAEARHQLDNRDIRAELNRLCDQARKNK